MIKFNNEKLIAYLTLISGLSISAVAVYYSVIGLTAIFAAAVVPIIIMGVALEISKLIATIWLKQNWNIAHWSIKTYLISAILILMFITSMGIFGFLSKAHSDQNLVSSNVLAKLAVYDEKIKTAKENIEADRRQLKQLDEAVDQVMARSTTEQGADKSVAIRKAQARDRSALAKNIEANQKLIATLNNEAAPIRAEVRKVEAEVGPLKYIAGFFYGSTDQAILEKSVTWVIIILIVVFDPLALILLLAAQTSFQKIKETTEGNSPEKESDIVSTATVTENQGTETIIMESKFDENDIEESGVKFPDIESDFDLSKHPYLFNRPKSHHPPGIEAVAPQVYKQEKISQKDSTDLLNLERIEEIISTLEDNVDKLNATNQITTTDVVNQRLTTSEWMPLDTVAEPPKPTKIIESNGVRRKVFRRPPQSEYVQNEEQKESNLWSQTTSSNTAITEEEYMAVSKNKNLS